jgi:nucleoside phosphorylase
MTSPSAPAPTAFICAMPMEIVPLVKKLSLDKSTIGNVPVRTGNVAGTPVVAIVTGMGPELARTKTTALLDATTVERVVVVGITGALENETPIGTLVMPDVVVDSATGHEYKHTPLDGAPTKGKMWTTDGLTTSPDDLARLRNDGVVSLDMETAAIAEVCEARGIPWSVYRVISDRASDGSIDEEVFHLSNQDGTPKPSAVVTYFVKHPGKIPQMMRLAKGARLATQRAADAAIAAVRNYGAGS